MKTSQTFSRIRLSIIIVNYNSKRWLADCLLTIKRQRLSTIEIILVDNHSTDDSLRLVTKKYPAVRIIRNQKNIGFGRANNLGSSYAKGDLLLFLNQDTKLFPGCLKEIINQMNHHQVDLLGPKILDFNNLDYYHGRHLTLDLVGSLSWGKKTTIIEGCCLAIKKSVFDALGQFDQEFFMYSEDLDLCWRAWLRGYKIKIASRAIINHFGGGSSLPTTIGSQRHLVPIFRRYETEKNTIRMMLKNASGPHLLLALPLMIILLAAESILYLVTGQGAASQYLINAVKWNIVNLSDTLHQRAIIQKGKRRSDMWPLLSKKITKFTVFKLIGIPKIKFNA